MNNRLEGKLIFKGIDITRAKKGNISKSVAKFEDMEGSKLHWISSKGTFYNKYIATNKIEEGYMVLARYSDVITKGNITYINRVKIKEY